jgi:hypothetical protein
LWSHIFAHESVLLPSKAKEPKTASEPKLPQPSPNTSNSHTLSKKGKAGANLNNRNSSVPPPPATPKQPPPPKAKSKYNKPAQTAPPDPPVPAPPQVPIQTTSQPEATTSKQKGKAVPGKNRPVVVPRETRQSKKGKLAGTQKIIKPEEIDASEVSLEHMLPF